MRSIAGLALTTAALFLVLVAVLLNSGTLFYMSTAIIATIAASRLQAWLSVKALKFERHVPERAYVGETVTVDISVWSDRRIKRPLILISDNIPTRMALQGRTPSLPVAPAFDIPVSTQYQFKPMRRGRFRWSLLTVMGTDALGLVTMTRNYQLPPAELLVLPTPIPLDVTIPSASGWGAAETQEGLARGPGIEPRGLREYVLGDSMRYVHWRSTAKTGQLLVKEFDTGSYATIGIVIQQTKGTVAGDGADTSLEHMVSNAAYLAERFVRQGAEVLLPGVEQGDMRARTAVERSVEVLTSLAGVEAEKEAPVSSQLTEAAEAVPPGGLIYVLLAVADPLLPAAISRVRVVGKSVVCLIYEPSRYVSKRRAAKLASASDAGYVEALALAGAGIVLVGQGGRG